MRSHPLNFNPLERQIFFFALEDAYFQNPGFPNTAFATPRERAHFGRCDERDRPPPTPQQLFRWLRANDLQTDEGRGLGSYDTCQFCGREQIRFVHHLAHADWPGTVAVGRICANDLAGDPAIDASERRLRNLAQRRAAFPRLKGWQTSEKGNLWIEYEGHHIVVMRKPEGGCRLRIDGEFGKLTYANKDRAMRRAFDIVQRKLARED